jgi:hypothetical protein
MSGRTSNLKFSLLTLCPLSNLLYVENITKPEACHRIKTCNALANLIIAANCHCTCVKTMKSKWLANYYNGKHKDHICE